MLSPHAVPHAQELHDRRLPGPARRRQAHLLAAHLHVRPTPVLFSSQTGLNHPLHTFPSVQCCLCTCSVETWDAVLRDCCGPRMQPVLCQGQELWRGQPGQHRGCSPLCFSLRLWRARHPTARTAGAACVHGRVCMLLLWTCPGSPADAAGAACVHVRSACDALDFALAPQPCCSCGPRCRPLARPPMCLRLCWSGRSSPGLAYCYTRFLARAGHHTHIVLQCASFCKAHISSLPVLGPHATTAPGVGIITSLLQNV